MRDRDLCDISSLRRNSRAALLKVPVLVASGWLAIGCSQPLSPRFRNVDKDTAGALLEEQYLGKEALSPARVVTPSGLALLKRNEGEVHCGVSTDEHKHCPYNDSSYYCTIGYGHLIAKDRCEKLKGLLRKTGQGDGISDKIAQGMLLEDLGRSQVALEAQTATDGNLGKAALTDSQYDALISFIFNVGTSNFIHSTLLIDLRQRSDVSGDASVVTQFLRWKRSNGKVVEGLLTRRQREIEHFFAGYPLPQYSGREAADTEDIDIRFGERP